MNKVLIIVSGPPCTGKTTLGRQIADKFQLPFIYKDGIKESLMDSLGATNREESRKLGTASYQLLYRFVESILKTGYSLVVESNFKSEYDSGQFRNLIVKYSYTPIQIQCKTKGDVLLARYKKRTASGDRHPGHFDILNYSGLETDILRDDLLKGEFAPLEIGGEVIYIDTTDFSKIDYAGLFENIRNKLNTNI